MRDFSITWSDLHKAVDLALTGDQGPTHSALFKSRKTFQNGQRSDSASLVIQFYHFQATDPRDKIYAFGGMADPAVGTGVATCYGDPVEVVYKS